MIIDTIVLYSLIQGHMGARKQKLLRQLSRKVFNWFEWSMAYHWDLLVWWTWHSFYLFHSIVMGENPTCMISLEKLQCLACIQTFGMMRKTTTPYILISVWITLTFIQGHSRIRNQKFGVHFLTKFGINSDSIRYVAKACLVLVCWSSY